LSTRDGNELPHLFRPRRPEDFDALYAGTPPWDIGRPQPALLALAEAGAFRGRVLDVGCGTGEHALLAARLGLDATGVDVVAAAIAAARAKAAERGLEARFLVWNALRLADLGERFDTVVDSGMYHVLDDDDRPAYVRSLAAATEVGGRLYLLCFSDRQPGVLGPRRVSREELRASFARGWRIDAIEPTTIDSRDGRDAVQAWLATVTRVEAAGRMA
jgi:cyclopropane fatty-acyl-phospholipid synthase-like methyltransferase